LLQLRRALRDYRERLPRLGKDESASFPQVLAENRSALWSAAASEAALERNKVENLRRAARSLNGIVVPAGAVFSFWRQFGRLTRRRGYVEGRQLQEGCLTPAVGGGICQLTNALYEAALDAGFAIVERHAHTRVVPGSAAERDRDATVAWNYLDLRFRVDRSVRLEVRLDADSLVVRFRSAAPAAGGRDALAVLPAAPRQTIDPQAHGCDTCGMTGCFRHRPAGAGDASAGATVFVLDECWPELAAYVSGAAPGGSTAFLPLDGTRWGRPQYAWPVDPFVRVHTAALATLVRAFRARRLGRYGSARLSAQLAGAREQAGVLARGLRPEHTRLCISQTVLPFLWRDGYLGGRRFEVLLTQTPLEALHRTLDTLKSRHPERATLGEFRAPDEVVRAEAEALAAAERVVTPHVFLASGFPGRALVLPWHSPSVARAPGGRAVGFLGPTAARKGAYELREAARELELEIVLYGSELEGEGFWEGVNTRRAARGDWTGVGLVVQPSHLEDRPRGLLAALALGLDVVATPACGVPPQPGLHLIEPGDPEQLLEAVRCWQGSQTP
jgi:hypothetical protein